MLFRRMRILLLPFAVGTLSLCTLAQPPGEAKLRKPQMSDTIKANIGDGGFILKFGDGTTTNDNWKAKTISWGPIDRDTKNPSIENTPLPEGRNTVSFDDSPWKQAKEYTEDEVGPKKPFFEFDLSGAKYIWSDDIALDNIVLLRRTVKSPPGGITRTDFTGLTNKVPDNPPRPSAGGRPQRNNGERK